MKALGTILSIGLLLLGDLSAPGSVPAIAAGQSRLVVRAASSPQALPPLSNITTVAAGGLHTCGLTTRGGVKCWGDNFYGQLGDDTTIDRPTPVEVVGLTSGATAIAGGGLHTCALTTGGGVKCWGANGSGQLGDGTTTDRPTPVEVLGLRSGAAAIAAGGDHTCVLITGGGVKCWGANGSGQLGDGTNTMRSTPVDVVGLTSEVAAVAAGGDHTCALTTRGGVKCWGRNDDGQLGNGTITWHTTPVDVVGLTSGAAAITAGGLHSCALITGGGVKCWGRNDDGELGDGTTTDRPTPVDVVGLTSGAAVAAGGDHTCILTTSGGVKCWGDNFYGELGDGTTTDRATPVDVVGLTSGAAIAVGGDHTCVLTTSGGVKCWGRNWDGQVGDGTFPQYRPTPADVVGLTSGAAAITAGGLHSCALTTSGGVKCWGDNGEGGLGDGTTIDRSTPADVVGLTSGAAAITTGGLHSCALTTGGGVKCWGDNFYGQLGDGTNTDRSTPVDVVGLTSGAAAITAGGLHTCVLTTGGGVKCWGANGSGQLGDGTTTMRSTPVDVVGLTSEVAAVAAGGDHSCALITGSGVKCWGANGSGQVGDGTTTVRSTPVDVVGLTSEVAAVAAGGLHTCTLTTGGGVKCWGANGSGQLGDGTTTMRTTPVEVVGLTSGAAAIATGGLHSCALATSGGVKCWGRNDDGQLGDNATIDRGTPVEVVGLTSGATAVAACGLHSCALTTSGGVKCWGANGSGQLGDGTTTVRTRPADVVDRLRIYLLIIFKNSSFSTTLFITSE